MGQALQLIKQSHCLAPTEGGMVHSSGGGAFKYADQVEEELGVRFNKVWMQRCWW